MTTESSNMLAPVHYDAKVTPQHPNTTLNIFHSCCAWLCTPANAQRADQDGFFLWGSRASHMAYHQKDVTYVTRYHGEQPLHALLMLHFFPLFFYLETRTLHSSMRRKHQAHSLQQHFCLFSFLFRAAKEMYCEISLCYYLISFFPLTWPVTITLLSQQIDNFSRQDCWQVHLL